MVKVPPVPSSLAGTFLVSGGAALDFLPVELSGTSSTVAQHSEGAHLPEWVQEVLPGFLFFLPGFLAAGACALAADAATAVRGLSYDD